MPFEPLLGPANELWPSEHRLESVEDLYSVTVDFGGPAHKVATHLFGKPITIIPYDLPRSDAADLPPADVPRGADAIASYFGPGEVGFALKHRRTENRLLSARQLANADDLTKEFKQHIKLQDVHIAAVLGVEERTRSGEAHSSIVVISNPESYPEALFYQRDYPMVFVRPTFPDWLAAHRTAFLNNFRSMLVCFNIVTKAPDNYDDQPLVAGSASEIRELVKMMIQAMASDLAAKDFFNQDANWIYCGELVHLAASAAALFPLNRSACEPLVGEASWSKFEQAIDGHNHGAPEALTRYRCNGAELLKIHLELAPGDLRPMLEYAPADQQGRLAFQPMSVFEVVEEFIKMHWPRERLGEELAEAQATVVKLLVPAFKAWTRATLDKLTETQRAEVNRLVERIVTTVRSTYSSRAEFEQSLQRVRDDAETFMADNSLQHLSTPPSLFHLLAQGRQTRGLLGMEYVGHGLHRSLVRRSSS